MRDKLIIVDGEGDAWGIPKLRRLSILEYLLWMLIESWSTLLVGYPKCKVDVDSGKFPLAKKLRLSIEPVGLKRIH